MSHLISGDSVPLRSKVKGVQTQIIPPNMNSLVLNKLTGQSRVDNLDLAMYQTRKLARKFILKQNELIGVQNIKRQQKQFQELKQRLYRYGMSKSDNNNFLREQSSKKHQQIHLNLVDNNRKVYIEKKYNTQFSIRLHLLRRDEDVQKSKKTLQSWNNRTALSVTRNPNFKRMEYLFNKMDTSTSGNSTPSLFAQTAKQLYQPYLSRQLKQDFYKHRYSNQSQPCNSKLKKKTVKTIVKQPFLARIETKKIHI